MKYLKKGRQNWVFKNSVNKFIMYFQFTFEIILI